MHRTSRNMGMDVVVKNYFERRLSPRSFNINSYDNEGFTPLMRIAACPRTLNHEVSEDDERRTKEVMSILLEHGADINMTNAHEALSARTALHFACGPHFSNIFKFLIDHGANPHVQDANGCTPLFYASGFANPFAMKALVECGADVNLKNASNDSPIISLMYNFYHDWKPMEDMTSCIKMLLENGARITDQLDNGSTPLSIAIQKTQECSNENLDLIRLLLDANADVSIPLTEAFDIDGGSCCLIIGDTPMHVAVKRSSIQLVKLLLEYHPKIICWNSEKETPLDCAHKLKHKHKQDIIQMIEQEQRHQLYKHFLHRWALPKDEVE